MHDKPMFAKTFIVEVNKMKNNIVKYQCPVYGRIETFMSWETNESTSSILDYDMFVCIYLVWDAI